MSMKNRKIINEKINVLILGSWLMVLLPSCQKEITIEPLPYESELYIECILNPELSLNFI